MKFYANPYNTSVVGFFFETYDEYEEKAAALRDSFGNSIEEFEIEIIDGTEEEIDLVRAMGPTQGNIEEILRYLDASDEDEWPAVFYVFDQGGNGDLSFDEIVDRAEDAIIVESSLKDAAADIFDNDYLSCLDKQSRELIERYIDYAAFARDRELSGDMREFEFCGKTYTCTNANYV